MLLSALCGNSMESFQSINSTYILLFNKYFTKLFAEQICSNLRSEIAKFLGFVFFTAKLDATSEDCVSRIFCIDCAIVYMFIQRFMGHASR